MEFGGEKKKKSYMLAGTALSVTASVFLYETSRPTSLHSAPSHLKGVRGLGSRQSPATRHQAAALRTAALLYEVN